MSLSKNYSIFDRLLHRMAFSGFGLSELLEDIEHGLFSNQWLGANVDRPVFVSSLPRSGTTVLLEALSEFDCFATHRYQNMPFIFSPVLWDNVSKFFRARRENYERAHNDGVFINADSPEAFEEVLWCKFFKEKYKDRGISLWDELNPDFVQYLREHMKKIVFLNFRGDISSARYLSKNNANISRICSLKAEFPKAQFIIPVRNPFEHAVSLMEQNLNFCSLHAKDSFSLGYMRDIGHFEFGALHKPIVFPGFELEDDSERIKCCDYWLNYWVRAFSYLLSIRECSFVSYEALCADSKAGVESLAEVLEVDASEKEIEAASSKFRPIRSPKGTSYSFDSELTRLSRDIYSEILARCSFKF